MDIILKGLPASSGTFLGRPISIEELKKNSFSKEKLILVKDFLTPVDTPFLSKIGAVVTEYGGLMSHSAIVCRELGIPCVTGGKNAINVLLRYSEVIVNGTEGKVYGKKKD
ncbi:MAG: PEP-utilizing enzyme [archaeon]|jgi:phosphoenolpyruvate synthase/pyruvate phosphate dikinase